MAVISVSDFSSFINRQIEAQEQIEAFLLRLEALITIAVATGDFYDGLPEETLRNYFLNASNLISEITQVNQDSLSDLFKHKIISY